MPPHRRAPLLDGVRPRAGYSRQRLLKRLKEMPGRDGERPVLGLHQEEIEAKIGIREGSGRKPSFAHLVDHGDYRQNGGPIRIADEVERADQSVELEYLASSRGVKPNAGTDDAAQAMAFGR